MIKFIRNILLAFSAGFIVPTLAFATMDQPTAPAAPAPKYSFQLSYDDAEGAIAFALAEKGAGNKISALITGHKNDAIFSYSKPISVEIRGLQYDKTASHWSASLAFVNDGDVVSAMPVAGRFEELVEVPVLKRPVASGEVIKASDIELRDYAFSRTRSDTITDIASLVGKSPARTISPSRPIRSQEIATPALVKKNGIVQIKYSSPGMEITTTGQAIEDGAKGSIISVRNLNSKKIIRAQVNDESTVSIIVPGAQSTELAGGNSYVAN
jgi:flagella basal body P-ring formation protein FlgA